MSAKRSAKAAHRPKAEPGGRRRFTKRTTRLLLLLTAAVVLSMAIYAMNRGGRPRLPEVITKGLEPIIAGQIDKALAEVRASPRRGPAWGRLGLTLQAHEFSAEARFCFAQAERLEPTQPRWPYFEALLLNQHDHAAATAGLRRAADLCDGTPDAPRLQLARALFELGQFDEARKQFQRLVDAQPDHAAARLGLVEAGIVSGRGEEFRPLLGLCLSNAFTARRAHTLLAQMERKRGRVAAADAAIRAATSLPPDRPWPDPFLVEASSYRLGRKAWAERAQQLLDQRRSEEAQTVVARLLKHYPDAPEGTLLQGRLNLERNDCAEAERAFRQHLQRAPESVNGHTQLGIALVCLERYADAIPALQRAIQLKPDYGDAHFNLGFALARAGRGPEAIPAFRNAIRFSPELVDAYITLADLLLQSGKQEEARRLLERAQPMASSDERIKLLLQRSNQ